MRKIPYYVILSTETIKNYIGMKKLIIFTAPSGAGKSTLASLMIQKFLDTCLSTISATNRSKRPGETDGKEYYFLNKSQIFEKITKGDFIEYEEVYTDCYYGTLRSEIERIWNLGKTPFLDVDVFGAKKIKAIYGNDVFIIGIDVPGNDISEKLEILRNRLESRDTDSPESITLRLKKAPEEIETILTGGFVDLIVVNSIMEESVHITENAIRNFLLLDIIDHDTR